MGELVDRELDCEPGARIRVKDVVPFVVLKFDPAKDTDWTVPDPEIFQELINRVEGDALEEEDEGAFRWANMWGKVGLLGLSSRDKSAMNHYRRLVENQFLGEIRFTLYPKDNLEKKGHISVLLRANLRSFDILKLPKALLRRTKRLCGGLRVTHVKEYSDKDRSRTGACKAGWRLVLLQGSPDFMVSLEKFGQDYRFPVGCGHVIVRGGPNRPRGSGYGEDAERHGGTGRGSGTAGPRRPDHQRHQSDRPGFNRSRRYSSDFPPGGLNDSAFRTGTGRGRGSGAAWGGPAHGGRGHHR